MKTRRQYTLEAESEQDLTIVHIAGSGDRRVSGMEPR